MNTDTQTPESTATRRNSDQSAEEAGPITPAVPRRRIPRRTRLNFWLAVGAVTVAIAMPRPARSTPDAADR